MDYLNEDIKKIKADFYEVIQHPYLRRYLQDPIIDHDQVILLYYLLRRKEFDFSYIKNSVLSTVLVQTALNVHETVSVTPWRSETVKRQRQLTVLSGDYYSSLYYYVLAKVDDVPFIRVLSRSIQEINEAKMNVYEGGTDQLQTLKDIRAIESLLIRNVAVFYHSEQWAQPLEEFFYFKVLLNTRYHWIERNHETPLTASLLTRKGQKRNELSFALEKEIEASKVKLHSFSYEWIPIREYILSRVDELLTEHGVVQDFVVEEG